MENSEGCHQYVDPKVSSDKPTSVVKNKRRLKRYTNPHTHEVVETRGGNHKKIKAWRNEHGNAAVDSWAEYAD